MDEDDYDQDDDIRDDTDPTAWGFGQDEEDIEDEWGAAVNSSQSSRVSRALSSRSRSC
jgi:hypothetical protein